MPLESLPSRIAARFISARTASFLTSSACGILVMCWIQQAQAEFGTSLISQTAIAIVGLLAVAGATGVSSGLARLPVFQSSTNRLCLLVMMQTIIAATLLFSESFHQAGWAAISSLVGETLPETIAGQISVLTAGSMVTWLVPFTTVLLLFTFSTGHSKSTGSSSNDSRRLTVAAMAAAFAMTVLSGYTGLYVISWIALSLGLTATAIEITLLLRNQATGEQADIAPDLNPIESHSLSGQRLSEASPWISSLMLKLLPAFSITLCGGILFSLLSRISGQLFFAASWQDVMQWSFVTVVAILSRKMIERKGLPPSYLPIVAAAWSVSILTAWPLLVRLALEINSAISTVAIAGTARALINVICIAPAGLVLACAFCWSDDKRTRFSLSLANGYTPFALLSAFMTGWLICRWSLLTAFDISVVVAVMSFLLAAVAIAERIHREAWRSTLRPTIAVCGIVVLAGPLLAGNYDPASSAKLLFDTTVFVAHQHESRTDILPHLDEGRCVATAETDRGTLTFWRYRGQQLQVRESGLPLSSVSCDTGICTQPSAESLQAILPLVMHEGPARLMLLGVRSGAVLQTSIAFPLESIVCVESDQNVINAVSRQVFSRVSPNPLEDARVELETHEPLLKLRASRETADIIIASVDQQGVPQAASMITTEYLTAASAALREGGLYCQPLDYADFGPDALQIIVATWQSVFSEVAAIEIAPGKLLFVATNSPAGIIRPGIVERLQRPNVRFALAQTGWDWSTPLRLSVYTDQGLTTAFGETRQHTSNVSGSRLTCLLPWEIMRWGDKYTAIMQKLAPVSQTLQFTVGEDAYTPEVKNRLAELTEQQELIHEHPDEYWFYRRKVKDRLTKTPQSELVQVKGEEPLHELQENEKRRVDYFKALGAAAKQKKPTPDDLFAIEEYAAPHDPLISLFLHQELAELATRNREHNAAIELRHRLHRVYFTANTDQAVRNVVASIELLCSHPEAISDDTDRADQLDALLQVLHDRWHNRGDTPPGSSKIVLNDIEQSIAAIDNAFESLETLNSARGYSPEQWQSRRLALEKALLRPLQAYRTTLMPHHAKSRLGR